MISVVLIEPEHAGNVGAIVRAMANFDFKELILVNPKIDHLSEEARCRAKNEQSILEKAKVTDIKILDKFDYVIGTTAKLGSDYNLPRCPLHPDELAKTIAPYVKKNKIALLIGREGIGLLNTEIALCDFVTTIPTSTKYATMNISHAAAILFYEIHKIIGENKITSHMVAARREDKDRTLMMVDKVLDSMVFKTKNRKETQQILWKRLVGKSFLTKREAFALMGFLNKIKVEKKK